MNLSTILLALNQSEIFSFSIFLVFIILMLSLDLGIFNKKEHIVSTREAAGWTMVWVMLALGVYVLLYYFGDHVHGISDMEGLKAIQEKYHQPFKIHEDDLDLSLQNYRSVLSLEYITGYLIELSLSVDNIFVIILIFGSFGVEKKLYHRVLFWGILGAILFRFLFIFIGAFLISKFFWITYIFGAFLVFTGIQMFRSRDKQEKIDTEKHPIVKLTSKFFSIHPKFEGKHFLVKINGRNLITPLFIVLLIVEFTDVIFAVDSVPAVFAITIDPYVVFFSNVFAIMGLRTMFFLLLNIVDKFHYFKIGLSVILVFVGVKMLAEAWHEFFLFSTTGSLITIISILLISVVASLLFPKKEVQK